MLRSQLRKALLVATLAVVVFAAVHGPVAAQPSPDGDLEDFPRPMWPYINVAQPAADVTLVANPAGDPIQEVTVYDDTFIWPSEPQPHWSQERQVVGGR